MSKNVFYWNLNAGELCAALFVAAIALEAAKGGTVSAVVDMNAILVLGVAGIAMGRKNKEISQQKRLPTAAVAAWCIAVGLIFYLKLSILQSAIVPLLAAAAGGVAVAVGAREYFSG